MKARDSLYNKNIETQERGVRSETDQKDTPNMRLVPNPNGGDSTRMRPDNERDRKSCRSFAVSRVGGRRPFLGDCRAYPVWQISGAGSLYRREKEQRVYIGTGVTG